MFHIAICDDFQEERETLKAILASLFEQRCLKASYEEYASGEELAKACIEPDCELDLIFLDIYMDGMDGLKTAEALRAAELDIPIVFLTTSPDFAIQSYDVAALSYLLKPLSREKLTAVMERFLQSYRPRSIFLQGRLFVSDDIVSVESRDKKVLLNFKNGATAELYEKLDTLEAALRGRNFLRCHQSFIVNMNYVRRVEDDAFITTLGTSVLIRKRELSQIRKKYFGYLTSL
ncbi:MAG: LytTR family DNA-binding domain-containing protein [Oscillospiraceae bacterium]